MGIMVILPGPSPKNELKILIDHNLQVILFLIVTQLKLSKCQKKSDGQEHKWANFDVESQIAQIVCTNGHRKLCAQSFFRCKHYTIWVMFMFLVHDQLKCLFYTWLQNLSLHFTCATITAASYNGNSNRTCAFKDKWSHLLRLFLIKLPVNISSHHIASR